MSDESPRIQIAALPFRKRRNRIEVLLVTSRETKRWIIPKGWPMKGLKDFTAAKREAEEEAGVLGGVSKTPLGVYDYSKRVKSGDAFACAVAVYPLRVTKILRNWKEKSQRTRQWFSVEVAASMVHEPQLRDVITSLIIGSTHI